MKTLIKNGLTIRKKGEAPGPIHGRAEKLLLLASEDSRLNKRDASPAGLGCRASGCLVRGRDGRAKLRCAIEEEPAREEPDARRMPSECMELKVKLGLRRCRRSSREAAGAACSGGEVLRLQWSSSCSSNGCAAGREDSGTMEALAPEVLLHKTGRSLARTRFDARITAPPEYSCAAGKGRPQSHVSCSKLAVHGGLEVANLVGGLELRAQRKKGGRWRCAIDGRWRAPPLLARHGAPAPALCRAAGGGESSWSAHATRCVEDVYGRGRGLAASPCSLGWPQDELLWAAAWLYTATKDNQYLEFVCNNQGWSQSVSEFSWDNKFAGAQALLAKEYFEGKNTSLSKYKTHADSFICSLMPNSGSTQIQTTPGGLLFTHDSANSQYALGATLVLLTYSKTLKSAGVAAVQCSSTSFTTTQITTFAKSQVDYILGNNPLNMSYMVGFGTKYPKRIHHRGASIPSIKVLPRKVTCNEGFTSWYSTQNSNPNTHVGAIVGGPDSNDQFQDVRSDSTHLEPTTYINAAFIGASAALLSEKDCLQLPGGISGLADDEDASYYAN